MRTLAHPRDDSCYDQDRLLWIDAQIRLLSERRYAELDIGNLVEELGSMKNKEQRALKSRLRVLIMHLLKCQYQKSHPQNKWRSTLVEQRERIKDLLEDSPSLRRKLGEYAEASYPPARKMAALETGLPLDSFPPENPYAIGEILDQGFTP